MAFMSITYFIDIIAYEPVSGNDIYNGISIHAEPPTPQISEYNFKDNYTTNFIDGKVYSIVFLYYYDLVAGRQDTVYISPNVGIINACNDSLSLKILE